MNNNTHTHTPGPWELRNVTLALLLCSNYAHIMPKASIPKPGLTDTWGRRNRKLEDKTCPECGKQFRPLRATSRYCSRSCKWKNNGGHNRKPATWWKNSRGYIEGRMWLNDNVAIHVKQHRFVVEGVIGRPLLPTEDVHHINGIKDDNRPENLMVIDHAEHTSKTNGSRAYRRGYKLNLSEQERGARSLRAITLQLAEAGRLAIAKAKGEA